MTGRRPLLLAFAALAVVAAVAVALVASPAPPEKPAPPRLAGKPLRLSEKPLFSGPEDVSFAEGLGDVLLFAHGNEHLTVVDAESGMPRWDDGDIAVVRYRETEHPGLARRHLIGPGVLVEYRHETDAEAGLMLLSTFDGSVVWQTPAVAAGENLVQSLRAVDDRVAVVTVSSGAEFDDPHDSARTVAFDVRTGAKLWESPGGTWAMRVVGDTLLSVAAPTEPGDLEVAPSVVVAHDALTGKPLWSLADRYPASTVSAAAGEVAVVLAEGSLVVVSIATGAELARHPLRSHGLGCQSDHRTTIVCSLGLTGPGGKQESVAVDGSGKLTRFPGGSAYWHGVWAGRAFIGDDRVYTVDSAGRRTGDEGTLPGRLVLLTENRAVFTETSAEAQVYEVDTR